MTNSQIKSLLHQLYRIANVLETVCGQKKRTIRTIDIDRGKVYKTHLGGKLRKNSRK